MVIMVVIRPSFFLYSLIFVDVWRWDSYDISSAVSEGSISLRMLTFLDHDTHGLVIAPSICV